MRLVVSVGAQAADLLDDRGIHVRRYVVSTAANGPGEIRNSFCTPRGHHVVRAKIGAGMPAGTVFVKRRPTGETCTPELCAENPGRDWILTRILWLSGTQPGFNRLGDRDTMQRYIYIHGTGDETRLGAPGSKGCIRMSNRDIVELFDLLPAGTPVEIME